MAQHLCWRGEGEERKEGACVRGRPGTRPRHTHTHTHARDGKEERTSRKRYDQGSTHHPHLSCIDQTEKAAFIKIVSSALRVILHTLPNVTIKLYLDPEAILRGAATRRASARA